MAGIKVGTRADFTGAPTGMGIDNRSGLPQGSFALPKSLHDDCRSEVK